MMGWMYDGGWLWMTFGFIFFILFWGSVIWLIVWAVKKGSERGKNSAAESALDIAKTRYARGEITREQFEQYKNDLV